MKRIRAILAASAVAFAAASVSATPARAEPWGHAQWGTNMHSPSCNCGDAQQPPAQARERPVPMAKQTMPSAAPDRAGAIPQQR